MKDTAVSIVFGQPTVPKRNTCQKHLVPFPMILLVVLEDQTCSSNLSLSLSPPDLANFELFHIMRFGKNGGLQTIAT